MNSREDKFFSEETVYYEIMTLNLYLGCAISPHAGAWTGALKAANTIKAGRGMRHTQVNQANTVGYTYAYQLLVKIVDGFSSCLYVVISYSLCFDLLSSSSTSSVPWYSGTKASSASPCSRL